MHSNQLGDSFPSKQAQLPIGEGEGYSTCYKYSKIIVIALAGALLFAAALRRCPTSIDAIRTLGTRDKIGAATIGIGMVAIAYGIIKSCCQSNKTEQAKHVGTSDNNQSLLGKGNASDPAKVGDKPKIQPADFECEKMRIALEIENVYRQLAEFKDFFAPLSQEQRMVIALYYINCRQQLSVINEKELRWIDESDDQFQETFCGSLRQLIARGLQCNDKILLSNKNADFCAIQIYDAVTGPFSVEASANDILEAYLKYNHLILLRPLKSDALMLGCGWGGCRSDCAKTSFYTHRDLDTVNIRLSMNPSVLCFWGEKSQMDFFKGRYSLIYDEGPIIAFISDTGAFWRACARALKKDGLVVIANHIFDGNIETEKDKQKWLPSPSDYRLASSEEAKNRLCHQYSYSSNYRVYLKL